MRSILFFLFFIFYNLHSNAQSNSIHWNHFQVNSFGRTLLVDWSTYGETNCARFSIYKKTGNDVFHLLDTVTAEGNPGTTRYYSYPYVLPEGYNCYSFYVKVSFTDGSFESSDTLTTCFVPEKTIFPNPIVSESGIIFGHVNSIDGLMIYFFDIEGRDVTETAIGKTFSNSILVITLRKENLKRGMYFLRIYNGSAIFYTQKMMIL